MTGDSVGLGLDEHGWIEQQRGREPYEVVREAVQNAMDTGADIDITVGYGDNYVVVEDDYEDGVEDLSHFYQVFSGDKRDSATKRGRFGRGAKELLAAADRTVVHTTGGTAVFEVEWDDGEYTLNGDIYDEITADEGTYIMATNDDWGDETLEDVEEYVSDILVPEGSAFTIEHIDHDGPRPERASVTRTSERPEYVIENAHLQTVVYEDGMQQKPSKLTDVEVYRTEEGDGGIYEMGIPVTTEEQFPFIFNVQQRTPVAEQRNKIEDSYREDLMQYLINENLGLLDAGELAQEYVTQYLSHRSYKIDPEVQEDYIRRRWAEPEKLLLTTDETTDFAEDKAEQMKIDLEEMIDVSGNSKSDAVQKILENHVQTAEGWVAERSEEVTIDVLDPSEDQEAFMRWVQQELIGRSSAWRIDQEVAEISGGDGGRARAMSRGGEILYNVFSDDWEETDPENVGTALHELAHEESYADGHGDDWYKKLQNLAGEVIVDQDEEIERLQEERKQLEDELDEQYEGLGDYVTSKVAGVKDSVFAVFRSDEPDLPDDL